MANIADGATGTVLTAPSPATSGTTLTLNAGEGYRYPAVPFFAVAHANNTIPVVSTTEKVQVTAQGQTTIASGSNGAALPQATINVIDTASLNSSGSVTIVTSTGAQVVAYTGKTSTTLTGGSGGGGTMSTGGAVVGDNFTIVRAISPYAAQSIAITWRFSNAIFASDLNNASIVRNEVPVGAVNGSNTVFTTASQFQTNSLEVYKNGVRMKGGGADYTATTTGFTMVTAPATGTVLLVDYFIGGTINNIGTNSLITDEVPAGTVNGATTLFTTARPYIAGSLEVFINGVKQARVTHFAETSPTAGTFTMGDAPITGDNIIINYQFNLNPASNSDTVDGIHASATPVANQLYPLSALSTFPHLVLAALKLLQTTVIASVGSITTTLTTIATLTNVPVPTGGRDIELEVNFPQITSTVSGDRVNIQILEGATILQQYYLGLPQNGWSGVMKATALAPSSGNHTYTVKVVRDSGTGIVQCYADAVGSNLTFIAKVI